MTASNDEPAMRDFVEWCKRERIKALSQIEWIKAGGSTHVQNVGQPIQETTEETLRDNREVVKNMDFLIDKYGAA